MLNIEKFKEIFLNTNFFNKYIEKKYQNNSI